MGGGKSNLLMFFTRVSFFFIFPFLEGDKFVFSCALSIWSGVKTMFELFLFALFTLERFELAFLFMRVKKYRREEKSCSARAEKVTIKVEAHLQKKKRKKKSEK